MKCPIVFNYERDRFYDADGIPMPHSVVIAVVNDLHSKLVVATEALEVYAYGSFACRCNYGDAHLGEPCRLDAYIRENGETIAREALAKIQEDV